MARKQVTGSSGTLAASAIKRSRFNIRATTNRDTPVAIYATSSTFTFSSWRRGSPRFTVAHVPPADIEIFPAVCDQGARRCTEKVRLPIFLRRLQRLICLWIAEKSRNSDSHHSMLSFASSKHCHLAYT